MSKKKSHLPTMIRSSADDELDEDAVIRKFRITAKDGKNYNTGHYNLSAIIAVGLELPAEKFTNMMFPLLKITSPNCAGSLV